MTDIEWMETLKKGDIVLWTQGEWRFQGYVEVVNHDLGTVVVNMESAHTKSGMGHDGTQKHESWHDEYRVLTFNFGEMREEKYEWMHRKTADIRIRVKATPERREFSIYGEGDGLSDADGVGGGLRYMNAVSVDL